MASTVVYAPPRGTMEAMRASACVLALLVACGPTAATSGSSGVPGSKLLRDLTVDEATALCLELADDLPERTVTCTDIPPFTAGYTQAECSNEMAAPATCDANVGDLRDCARAYYHSSDAELCANEYLPDECGPLIASDCPF